MPMTEQERSDARAQIERGHRELTAVLDELDAAAMERPGALGHWSGKDILSHIAAWEVEGTRFITARDAGSDESLIGQSQFDAFNEENVARTCDWTLDQVRAYFESAHRDYVNACRRSQTVTARFATGLSSHHYEEHIDQFRSLRSVE